MTRASHSSTWPRAIGLFALVALPLLFWRLDATDVVTMEGIVADGARHMDRSGDYMVPRLHGEIYAYKPPLAYWLALASSRVFGESEWALRLPFVLSGLLMAFVVFASIGRRLGPRVGLLAGLASITGVLASQKLRLAEWDIMLAAGVGVAVTLAILELTSEKASFWRWQAAYLSLCLAFLTKGMPALMFFAPGLLAAAFLTGSWRRLFTLPHIAGGVSFLIGCGAWIAGAWQAEGWGAFAQAFSEAGDKGFTWSLDLVGSTLAKPLTLFACFLPWTLALPALLRSKIWQGLDDEAKKVALAATGFAGAGLLTFMAVPATETRYLLPLTAPLGILCAVLLRWESTTWPLRIARGLAVVVGVALAAGIPWLVNQGELDISPAAAPLLVVTGLALLALTMFSKRLPWSTTVRSQALILAIGVAIALAQILAIDPHRASSRSMRGLAELFDSRMAGAPEIWVGLVRPEFKHSSIFFYLQRPVRTFSDVDIPPVGAYAVLFSDEHPGIDGQAPFEYDVLEDLENRGITFQLVRVRGAPAAD